MSTGDARNSYSQVGPFGLAADGRTSPYYGMRNNLTCISTLKLFDDSASAMKLVAGMKSI